MDVQCEKCGTEYALDETLVGPSGTAVRCTSCGHVFKVYAAAKPTAAQETWMLRQASGATFPFGRLGVLQEWISAGKVSEDDLIAKSGGEWKRLGDIAEMRPFFDAARPHQQSMPSPAAVSAGYHRTTPSDVAATIRAPAGGLSPSAPPRPSATGPSTAEYGVPHPDAFAATQQMSSLARPSQPVQPGAPTQPQMPVAVQANAPTVQAHVPTGYAPTQHYDVSTATTQPQMGMAPPQRQSEPHAPTEMAPTRPLKPMPDSVHPPPAAPSAGYDPSDAASTVALSADDPRYAKAVSRPPRAPTGQPTVMSEPSFTESQIPAAEDEGRWERGAGVQAEGPAWAERGAPIRAEEDVYDEERPERKRSVGKWIALVIIVLLVGAGFYMFMFQRPIVDELLGGVIGGDDGQRQEKFFAAGEEQFALDTFPAFKQADREYQKVLALSENDTSTLAALSRMYAVWAQYLRDTALDARADSVLSAGADATSDLHEIERLEADMADKLADAKRFADQAVEADPASPAAHLALADVKRLSGDLDGARNEIERARSAELGAAVDYVAALITIDEGAQAGDAAAALEQVVAQEPLLRALYRRGRALAAAGDTAGAKAALARVTEVNSQHGLARDLTERVGAGKPVFLTLAALEAKRSEAAAAAEKPDAGAETDTGAEPPKPAPVKFAGGGGEGAAAPVGGSPDALLARAAKLQQSGNSSAAADLFEKVLEVQPSNIDALCGLGYCFLDRGNKGQAIAYFRRALGVNGTYGPAIIGLANTYKSQGNKAEALKWYKRYLEVSPGGRHAALAKTNIERLEGEVGGGGASGEGGEDTGGDKPPADTGDDKPAGGTTEPQPKPPTTENPYGGSEPPAAAPSSSPSPPAQPPATEG